MTAALVGAGVTRAAGIVLADELRLGLRGQVRRVLAPRGVKVVQRDGATVLVDQVSLPFLEGSTIDFVDDLIGQSFKIQNPHATASCGCGTSFSM